MRQFCRIASIIAALALLVLFIPGAGAARTPAPAAATHCVYLPLVQASGPSDALSTNTVAPLADGCPPADAPEPPNEVSGALRLRPAYAKQEITLRVPRYLVVFDASGSMSANFNGQCDNIGIVVQCANGPASAPPIEVAGVGYTYYWKADSERRIYVAKKAIERLAHLANLPGNPGYTTARPDDQIALVWFNESTPATNALNFSNDPITIINFITNANKTSGDAYRSQGGTNGAAGLYRAALLLQDAPPTVPYNGGLFTYQNNVIFLTDGVSNQFLDTNAASLGGGQSIASTYPVGSYCHSLGDQVVKDAACQTTDVGGMYNGWDRPISQMVDVSARLLRSPPLSASVFAIGLSDIPSTGLMGGVSSSNNSFFVAVALETKLDGTTNVDMIIDEIHARIEDSVCVVGPNGAISNLILSDEFIDGTGGLTYPNVGQVRLSSATSIFYAPIRADAKGRLSYTFTDLPPDTYRIEAYLFYHHLLDPPGVMRMYSRIWLAEQSHDSLTIDLDAATLRLEQPLTLKLTGDVCASLY